MEMGYPITIDTTSGPCTVLREKQMYQHIKLKLSWESTGVVDLVWVTLADNCEDGFDVCDDRAPANVMRLLRQVSKAWLNNWHAR